MLTSIDGWLEDTTKEMTDYGYGGRRKFFAEYGQGYAGSIDKIPEEGKEGCNQFKNKNWTQRVEITTKATEAI